MLESSDVQHTHIVKLSRTSSERNSPTWHMAGPEPQARGGRQGTDELGRHAVWDCSHPASDAAAGNTSTGAPVGPQIV